MFNVPTRKKMRPIGVLLGGSGRACMLTMRPQVAALLRPCLCACERGGSGKETGTAEA